MKTVYTADKHSYGTEFFKVCNTLDELKRAIVKQEMRYEILLKDLEYTEDMYTEKLFKKYAEEGGYRLAKVDLHKDEEITFGEYDGKSWFNVVKKDPKIISKTTYLNL